MGRVILVTGAGAGTAVGGYFNSGGNELTLAEARS